MAMAYFCVSDSIHPIPSMEVLPEEVTIDVLSRLPVKTIIHCKSVCKKWRNLVSSSYFVNLHLSRSHTHTGFIIHHDSDINMSNEYEGYTIKNPGILMWVEIEEEVDDLSLTSLDLNLTPIFQNSRIHLTGSVNGLICLWQHSPKLDNTYICNPITREYIILPRQRCYKESGLGLVVYGFGVSSSVTREYKVVRIYKSSEAEVYTLGTGQWRSLGRVPKWLVGLYPFQGTFLNNHCHWILYDWDVHMDKLCTFDLDKETFRLFPSPPPPPEAAIMLHRRSLAVLKGCLCKLDNHPSQFTIWVMKEYGIKKSWHKEVAITPKIDNGFCWPRMSLIEGLKDGTILMVNGEDQLWAYHPQSNTLEDTEIYFHRFLRGLAYHPSFLKLDNFESERVHML